jgi:signal transduction histidine kinase
MASQRISALPTDRLLSWASPTSSSRERRADDRAGGKLASRPAVSRERYLRERQARGIAEQLLEAKSRELYEANVRLQDDARRLEAIVHERTAELRQALERANAATSAKSAFLASMSHEIRTPLNGVIGVASAPRGTQLDERQGEMLGLIEASGQTLQRLLSDILDLSKIDAGTLDLHVEPFDLRGAVESAAHLLAVRSGEKGRDLPDYLRRQRAGTLRWRRCARSPDHLEPDVKCRKVQGTR